MFPQGFWWGFANPYEHLYRWRCRWFPWLPRWWWTGLYGLPMSYVMPQEQEVAMLEEQAKMLENALEEVKKRLEELKKVTESN